jgi:protein NrfD
LFWSPAVHWGFQIAVYLFLGGLAGGSYITGYVADLLSLRTDLEEEYIARRETARWGMYVAVVSIGVGGVALVLHLGQPLRAFYFPITFTNYGSWMVIGTWAIVIFTLWAVLQAFWYTFGSEIVGEKGTSLIFRRLLSKYVRLNPGASGRSTLVRYIDAIADITRPPRSHWLVFGSLGVGLAVVLIAYTALLVSAVESVALWNRAYLPFIFLMSGISTGIAAATGLTIVFEGMSETVHQYSLVDDGLIVVELLIIGLLLSTLEGAGLSGALSQQLLNGDYALYFWGLIILGGLTVPVVGSLIMTTLCYPQGHDALSDRMHEVIHAGFVAKYALVLVGGFFLRFVVLLAAVQQPYIPLGV